MKITNREEAINYMLDNQDPENLSQDTKDAIEVINSLCDTFNSEYNEVLDLAIESNKLARKELDEEMKTEWIDMGVSLLGVFLIVVTVHSFSNWKGTMYELPLFTIMGICVVFGAAEIARTSKNIYLWLAKRIEQ